MEKLLRKLILPALFISLLLTVSCGDSSSGSDDSDDTTDAIIDVSTGTAATSSDISFSEVKISGSSITLSWDSVDNSSLDYWYVSYSDGTSTVSAEVDSTETSYTFSELSAESDYTLILQAVDAEGSVLFRYAIDLTTDASSVTEEVAYNGVNSSEELKELADTTANYGENHILMYDVSLSEYTDWTPIGSYTSAEDNTPYTGTFDGAGHVITGLTITSGESYQGLFGYSSGTIKNLGITDCSISVKTADPTVSYSQYAGALVGYNNGGSISNCYSTGTISSTYYYYMGGLIGFSANGTITNSYSSATVTGPTEDGWFSGGFIGYDSDGTITGCHATGSVSGCAKAGGFAGKLTGSTVSRCYATGDVSGLYQHIAGFEGINEGKLTECYATGDVSSESNWVGGITGRNFNSTSGDIGEITKCYYNGSVSSTSTSTSAEIGGIAGENDGTISESYAAGTVTSGDSSNTCIGGVIGENQGGTVDTISYYNSTDNSTLSAVGYDDSSITSVAGLTTTQMQDSDSYDSSWVFSESGTWAIDSSVNNGYPYLRNNPPVE